MTRRFIVGCLGGGPAEAAYPMARVAVPSLTLEQWRRFLAAAETARLAVMVAKNERGYIHGLCTCRAVPDLRHGAVLEVDDFVVLDLIDGCYAALALLEGLEAEARRQRCAALRLHLPQDRAALLGRHPLTEALREAGHETESVRLVKLVDGAAACPDR